MKRMHPMPVACEVVLERGARFRLWAAAAGVRLRMERDAREEVPPMTAPAGSWLGLARTVAWTLESRRV
jgi:hypothetical protein